MNQIQSKFGTILKRETLTSAKLSVDLPFLVLCSSDPYPGYYCSEDFPADNSCKGNAFYLPIQKDDIREETLCRISLELQSRHSVNICPAWFNFEDTHRYAFRVKEIEEAALAGIIKSIEDYKLTLFKSKKVKRFLSYIHLKEFFEIRQIEQGIFENSESKALFYINIPEQIDWEVFEKIITYQKSNSKFRNFDAAIGLWIQKPQIQDFIRIYGVNMELKQLKEIEKEFIRNMKKYKKQGMLI